MKIAVGDLLRLTVDIWDDGCENHHPPGYLARKNDVVVVRNVKRTNQQVVYASHPHITSGSFSLYDNEYTRLREE